MNGSAGTGSRCILRILKTDIAIYNVLYIRAKNILISDTVQAPLYANW